MRFGCVRATWTDAERTLSNRLTPKVFLWERESTKIGIETLSPNTGNHKTKNNETRNQLLRARWRRRLSIRQIDKQIHREICDWMLFFDEKVENERMSVNARVCCLRACSSKCVWIRIYFFYLFCVRSKLSDACCTTESVKPQLRDDIHDATRHERKVMCWMSRTPTQKRRSFRLARCDTHVWKVVRCPFSIVNTRCEWRVSACGRACVCARENATLSTRWPHAW